MKIVETKIYLRFISWFIIVALLPLASLFVSVYFFNYELFYSVFLQNSETRFTVLFAIFISLALVLILSLLITKLLSKSITNPIQISLVKLSEVVDELFKSIQNLSDLSQNNSELSQFLISSSQIQQKDLKFEAKAVSDMTKSLKQVANKTKLAVNKTISVDNLATESSQKSKEVLDSLVVVKQLLTENQKLSQALDRYAKDVQSIASRVGVLAETARFISLNVTIEANKRSFSEDFSSLVSQIRELNITSEQAAQAIEALGLNMEKQIEQGRDSSEYQWKETNKTIDSVGHTISNLNNIAKNINQVTKNVQAIDKETHEIQENSENINVVIKNLNKESKLLVGHVDIVTQAINRQLIITRALNRSSAVLNSVTSTLNDLVGRK